MLFITKRISYIKIRIDNNYQTVSIKTNTRHIFYFIVKVNELFFKNNIRGKIEN